MAATKVIKDQSRHTSGWTSIALGMVSVGCAGVPIAIVTYGAIANPNPLFFVFGGILAIFAVAGIVGVIFGIRSLWLGRLLGVPTLVVPDEEPLCLGSVLVAGFHRSGGARHAQRMPVLSAELVCREEVTYAQGTGDHTVSEEIYRHELVVRNDNLPDSVSGQVEIEIPVDRPPTLALTHNRIIWSVQVRVQVMGVPDDTGTFTIEVLPVVAAHLFGTGGPGRGSGSPR
jgi:hypothetical protein